MIIMKLIAILTVIESDGIEDAVNVKGNAVGVLQIRPRTIKKVNQIVKINGGKDVFNNNDRLNRGLSIRMCRIFLRNEKERYVKEYGREPSDLELAGSWSTGNIFNKVSESYKSKMRNKGIE